MHRNCTLRSETKNSKYWKQQQQTETIKNQCMRNKWKIDIKKWKKGLWPSTSTKCTWKNWLAGLACDQRERLRALIKEKCLAFSVDDDDIVNVTSHQMEICLNGKSLVQQNYNSVPRTSYGKLKNYIEDPLNKKWIINSKSFNSSPVVAARKKDGSLQHYCNYCKVNLGIIPDQYPLLITCKLLNKNKGYLQLHLALASRRYTAFIIP